MFRNTFVGCATLSLALGGLVACGGDSEEKKGGGDPASATIIGAIYAENAGDSELAAARLAIKDINDSGVFEKPWELQVLRFNDSVDRQDLAREFMDKYKSPALLTNWSSTGLQVLRLTNSADYNQVTQCSSGSTNTVINNPNSPDGSDGIMADKNDTFYRAVANDIQQAALVWQLVPEKSKAGFYYVNDAYGESFLNEIKKAADSSGGLAFEGNFEETYKTATEKPDIDKIIELNQQGKLSSVILIGLPSQGGPIMKALSEATPPFNGTLIVADGMIDAGFFAPLTATFTGWLQTAGNAIIATAPETYEGQHTQAFLDRLSSFSSDYDANSPFTPSTADCIYSFAVSLMHAEGDARTSGYGIKEHMVKLKAGYIGSEPAFEVNPSSQSLKDAQDAIRGGQKVRMNAASGDLRFDSDGDRAVQLYKTLKVEGTGPYNWVRAQVWDPSEGKCVKYCE